MKKFIEQYNLSKTLRFELKPVGKTLENIQKKELLQKDEDLAESYTKMKETIDEFHKDFIKNVLSNTTLDIENLKTFKELYYASQEQKKTDSYKEKWEEIQQTIRKEIVYKFKTQQDYDKLFKEELIKKLLENFAKQHGYYFDDKFKNFTTYFTGFHENRKNIYTDQPHSTAIAYRLIHENLPKFLDNIKIFEKVKQKFGEQEISQIEETLFAVLQGQSLQNIFTLEYYNKLLTQKGIDFFNQILGGYAENSKKIQGLNEYINLYNQQQKDKKDRIPKLKAPYKQILSDRQSISFLPDLATKINQSNSEEEKKRLRFDKEKIAKERGELLKNNFTDWKTFMVLYRTYAQEHGKILSTLKGIEKERVESQLLKYWAVILQENEQHKLVLISREKAKDAYEWIKKNKVKPNTENISYNMYWFESFTYKSLQKLCFEHTETGSNQFKPNIEDLFEKHKIKGEFSFEGDEQRKIDFYKDVLKHQYTCKSLNLPFEQINAEIINKKFETLDEFQIALEKYAINGLQVLSKILNSF